MKRLLFLLLVCTTALNSVYGQKKEIAQAQTYIKAGKDLDKAESMMRTLLKDSANTQNMKIWLALTEAIKMQYEQGNEKLYLKQAYDTTALFQNSRKMFLAFEAMDSVDAMPDTKGRVELKYRKKNAQYLNVYRKNLYNGGLFFMSKQKYVEAFPMFDAFIDCERQPLFSAMKYGSNKQESLSACYLATYCGARLGDKALTMKYADRALAYQPGRENVIRFMAEVYQGEKNDSSYCRMLRMGVEDFPKSEYFFTRLVDYYNTRNMADSAMNVVEKAIATDSLNTLFLYAKANILLNTGRYDDCIRECGNIIKKDDAMADAYYSAGVAYLNLAFEAEKQNAKSQKKVVKAYYSKAMPYMERYRELAPESSDKWASALYNIYLNLNIGKKFEEVSRILEGE